MKVNKKESKSTNLVELINELSQYSESIKKDMMIEDISRVDFTEFIDGIIQDLVDINDIDI